jgi:voltage-gated potassium channel
MKQKIYKLVEKGSHGSQINLIFDYLIITLIVFNVIAIALDTLSGLTPQFLESLKLFEIVSIIIFTIEYLMRLYVSDLTHPSSNRVKSLIKFIVSPYGLIDLLAILPFYIPLIITMDLRFLRIIRLIRFFRVFKISRYNSTLKLIGGVLKEKKAEFGMTFFIATLLLLISAYLMYFIENPVQPDKFPNIFASLWWAVATVTSVGNGDITPITTLGKAISGIIAALGIGLIALPTGIISAGFMEKAEQLKKDKKKIICPHCGKELSSDNSTL